MKENITKFTRPGGSTGVFMQFLPSKMFRKYSTITLVDLRNQLACVWVAASRSVLNVFFLLIFVQMWTAVYEKQTITIIDIFIRNPVNSQSFNRPSHVQNAPTNMIDSSVHTCMKPLDALEGTTCNALKETILNSTLRIQTIAQVKIEGQWISVLQTSHATVKNENTLVSHNHFYSEFTAAGYKVNIISMELFSASGDKIPGQWKDFTIIEPEEATETSLLQFGETDLLIRVLNMYGIKPAVFGTATLKTGDEVGQIVLTDDFTTELRWTTISADPIEILGGQAVLISGPVNPGSSGGGIFLGEVHIANNWFTTSTKSGGSLNSLDVTR